MDAEPGSQTRPVELSGTPEKADAGSSGTVSTRKYNASQPGAEQFQMKIANKVGLVIGKSGETRE